MPSLAELDRALSQPGRFAPALRRLGGGSIAMVAPNQPWRAVGDRAVVYRVDDARGGRAALRIYLADEPDDRSTAVTAALARDATLRRLRTPANSPLVEWIVPFPDGVQVANAGLRSRTVPLVAMEWVQGPTLMAAADRASRDADRRFLEGLARAWLTAVESIAEARFVHGELNPDNAIVDLERGIMLVDYDNAWWPGQPDPLRTNSTTPYVHRRNPELAAERLDDFPALVIYASLRILAVEPTLRREFGEPAAAVGGALLFRARDLARPDSSRLFKALRQISDPEVQALVGILHETSVSHPDTTPRLPDIASAASRAGRSHQREADRVAAEVAETAKPRRKRPAATQPKASGWQTAADLVVETAQEASFESRLGELRLALAAGDDGRVTAVWLDLRTDERSSPHALRAEAAVQRVVDAEISAALQRRNESIHAAIERSIQLGVPVPVEALEMARQLERSRHRLHHRGALFNAGNPADIAGLALSGAMDDLPESDLETRAIIKRAFQRLDLERALAREDEAAIAAAAAIELGLDDLDRATLDRIALARARLDWLRTVRASLRARDAAALERLTADPPPGAAVLLSPSEQRRLQRSVRRGAALATLQTAFQRGDDRSIVDALTEVEASGATLPPDLEWSSVRDVIERLSLVQAIRRTALSPQPDYARLSRLLPAARDVYGGLTPYLGTQLDFNDLERDVQRAAQRQRLREAIAAGDPRAIASAADPDVHGAVLTLDPHERAIVEQVVSALRDASSLRGQPAGA